MTTKKENVPAIRFKEFTDAWKRWILSDITQPYTILNGQNLKLESFSLSKIYGFINQKRIYSDGSNPIIGDKRNSQIVESNSFAMDPSAIHKGAVGLYELDEKVLVSPMYLVFKTKGLINNHFLLNWFKSYYFSKITQICLVLSARVVVDLDRVMEYKVSIPEYKEQSNIAKLFLVINAYLSLLQRKLDKLKNIKETLLEKMFV
ncbi:type I restriction modification DNA specificity protein, partial [Mycoplasmopsis mustelae]